MVLKILKKMVAYKGGYLQKNFHWPLFEGGYSQEGVIHSEYPWYNIILSDLNHFVENRIFAPIGDFGALSICTFEIRRQPTCNKNQTHEKDQIYKISNMIF